MSYLKIHAYVRSHRLEKVQEALADIGISGFSYCRVKGTGEYANYYAKDLLVERAQFDIFVCDEQVDDAVEAIIGAASTHTPGDGVIAVMPVSRFFRIRSDQEAANPQA